MLNVIMLSVVVLDVIMLSVVVLDVIMLSVVVPIKIISMSRDVKRGLPVKKNTSLLPKIFGKLLEHYSYLQFTQIKLQSK